MDNDHCQFQQLPFSKLFDTYITDYSLLSEFYAVNPFDESALKIKAKNSTSGRFKNKFAGALKAYHDFLGINKDQLEQRNKLADPDSLAIVTGQQLGVYGGPLFTIYKTITAIVRARELEKELDVPVVPVFWLADEDHDFDEISWVGIPHDDVLKKLKLNEEGNGKAVAEQQIEPSVIEFEEQVREELHDTDFSDDLFELLGSFYKPGKLHVQAFAQMMNHWFGEYGLLIAGSNFRSIKQIDHSVFVDSVLKAEAISESLEQSSEQLERNYHRQVLVGDSNLFFLDDESGRIKVEKESDNWIIGENTYSADELSELISKEPWSFSPNVFLRPVLQDMFLPTLAYVAGPGELAYYGQMKKLYPHFGLEMPAILPRLSVTLIESSIERIMEKLPFQMCSYNKRIEDLESAYVDHANSYDVEGVFEEWKNTIEKAGVDPTAFIKEIDPTLEGTAGKVIAGFENELNKLKGKVYRSVKQQEETQLKRIARIKSQLFPDGLQEREVSPVYFMNKYGLNLWNELLEHFSAEPLDLRKHHIVKL